MSIVDVDVTVVIGGVDYSSDVVSLARKHNLCSPGQTFELGLDPGGDYSAILPYQSVTIHENGVLVLTGYTTTKSLERPPNRVTVEGGDTYKRCQDTFIPEDTKTDGETVGYWVDYLCDLAGVTYSIDAVGSDYTVIEDLSLGLKTVNEALLAIVNYVAWVIVVKPNGVVSFINISEYSDRNYYVLTGARSQGDADARNACIVWGMYGVYYTENRPVTGTGSGRTMVLSNAMIRDVESAQYLARYMLNQFASLDDVLSLDILGDPNIQVGEVVTLDFGGTYTNTVTEIQSTIDTGGYRMSLTIGRKCLAMMGVTPSDRAVYVGTEWYIGRCWNFYSSGSALWQYLWPNSSGSYAGVECLTLDRYNPQMRGYVSGSFGLTRSQTLGRDNPTWAMMYSPSQFASAVGKSLVAITNVSSAETRNLLYAQAVASDGGIYVGRSLNSGSSWTWSGEIDKVSVSPLQPLGFSTRGSNEVWTTGSIGRLYYCSTGSTSLSFTNTYNVPDATSPINNIQSPKGTVYLGGYRQTSTTGSGGGGGSYPTQWHFPSDIDSWGYLSGLPFETAPMWVDNVGHDALGSVRSQQTVPEYACGMKYDFVSPPVSAPSGGDTISFWVYPTGTGYGNATITLQWNDGGPYQQWSKPKNQWSQCVWSLPAGMPDGYQLRLTATTGAYPSYGSITVDDIVCSWLIENNPGQGPETIYSETGYVYASSGSTFINRTPNTGGATALRSLTSMTTGSGLVFALGTSGSISGSRTSGSPWSMTSGSYPGGCGLTQNWFSPNRTYWLSDYGIFYSSGSLLNIIDRIGNWSSVYGDTFENCGTKKFIVPGSVL